MKYWTKVCGLSREEDIDVSIANGVDALGFLLATTKSQRVDMLPYDRAKELIAYVDKRVDSCLLIHLSDLEEIIQTIAELNPSMVQIQKQSNLTVDELSQIKVAFPNIKIIKTFYLSDTNSEQIIEDIESFIDSKTIDFVLIDSAKGGSGVTHNWNISTHIVQKFSPFACIIAGGLTPDNIKEAIMQIRPFGVDVMSGVSVCSGGVKDKDKIKQFCDEVRDVKYAKNN